MKRITVFVALIAVLFVFVFACPVMAADPLGKRLVKFVFSPIIGTAELVNTTLTNVFTGKEGPIVSALKGTSNGVGRVVGDFANIFKDSAYTTPYFANNGLAEEISTPPVVDIIDWTVTGGAIGLIGSNSAWWGMTDGQAMAVFGASGAAAGGLIKEANE